MTPGNQRTAEQIREEIRLERARLDAALATLGADAKRSGKVAGSLLAALGSVLVISRLSARLRKR
jgi:hypothetical protein